MTEATQALRFERPLDLQPIHEVADINHMQADVAGQAPVAAEQAAHSRFKRIGALAGVALVTMGAAELVKPDTAEGRYSGVGPALSGNLGTANKQFDEVLRVTGPNTPLAISIGDRLGIKTSAGRAKYVTPENIDLRRKRTVTNLEFPGNTASNGVSPVLVPNKHRKSEVFTVAADRLPGKSLNRTRKVPKRAAEIRAESHSSSSSESRSQSRSKMEFEVKASVLRRLCENMLDKLKSKKQRSGRVHNSVNINVAYGIKSDLWAKSLSESSSASEATVICPDGRAVTANASAAARSKALAHASQSIRGKLSIKYRGTSYSKFQVKYQQLLNSKINAATSTVTETNTSVGIDCGPFAPPPPPPPECPPGATMPFPKCFPDKVNNPPTGEMAPPEHLYPQGIGKICVKNIIDLDGDPVKAFGALVYKAGDPNKAGVGEFLDTEFKPEPGGAQCIPYKAPPNSTNTQQNLTAEAWVTDGVNSTPVAPENFILLKEDFGPAKQSVNEGV